MVLLWSNETPLVLQWVCSWSNEKAVGLQWFCFGPNEKAMVLHWFCLGSNGNTASRLMARDLQNSPVQIWKKKAIVIDKCDNKTVRFWSADREASRGVTASRQGVKAALVLYWFCLGSNEKALVLQWFCLGVNETALVLYWCCLRVNKKGSTKKQRFLCGFT